MKMGLFLIYGAISFVLTLNVSMSLNGNIQIFQKSDSMTFFRFKVVGLEPTDWVRAAVVGFIVAFAAGLAPVSGVWGIISLIVALGAMTYDVYWSIQEASEVREVISFLLLLAPLYFMGKMSAIATGSLSSSLSGILVTIVQMAVVAAIAIIIAAVLIYHYKWAEGSGRAETFKYSAIGVAIVALVVEAIVLF